MGVQMERKKRLKSEVVSIRVDPTLKKMAERAAAQQHRSLSNLIEHLLIEHCERVKRSRREENCA